MSVIIKSIYSGRDIDCFLTEYVAKSRMRIIPQLDTFFGQWHLVYQLQLPDPDASLRQAEQHADRALFIYPPTINQTDYICLHPNHSLQLLHILLHPEWVANNSFMDLPCFQKSEPILSRNLGNKEYNQLKKLLSEVNANNRKAYIAALWDLLLAFAVESRKEEYSNWHLLPVVS